MNVRPLWMLALSSGLFSSAAVAQYRVAGQVASSEDDTVPFAHILLFQAEDSTFLKGAIADEEGNFILHHAAPGNVFVKTEMIGYQDHYSDAFEVAPLVELGTILLSPESAVLEEVVVSGRKPLYEQRVDRTIVNVQSSATNVGNSALSVLSKSPSVTVNRSTHQINLMGKEGVLVTIDNKQVRMEAADLIALLEGMPADNIATIELITAPPASYDAQGSAGIININTRQGEREGLTGQYSLNGGYGRRPKYEATLNLDYQKNKFYTYAKLSTSTNYSVEEVSILTDVRYPQEQLTSTLDIVRKPRLSLHSGEVGLDYFLTDRTTLGILLSAQQRDWVMTATARTHSEGNLGGTYRQLTESDEENTLVQTLSNVNLRHQFTQDLRFTVDYDYLHFKRNNPTEYRVTTQYDEEAPEDNRGFLSEARTPLRIHVLKADLQHKLSEQVKWETGVKTTFSDFTNHVRVANGQAGQYVNDPDFTDTYDMEERLNAAYLSADWQVIPSLNLKAGWRYEHYTLSLASQHQGAIINRTRGQLFPSASLSFQPEGDTYELSASYVRRVQRPGFLTLAPYFYFFDPNTLFTGNPGVVPTLSDQYQLGMRYKTLTASLQWANDQYPIFNWQPDLDEDWNMLVVRPQQAELSRVLSLTVAVPWEINDWWTSHYHLIGHHRVQGPVIKGEVYRRRTNSVEVSTTHEFAIGQRTDLEAVGAYYSPLYEGIVRTDERFSLDVGIRRKFTSGASLAFNVSDVFNRASRWPLEADARPAGLYYTWLFDAEGPIFRMSFSMPLGNQRVGSRDRRASGSEEEQRRLN